VTRRRSLRTNLFVAIVLVVALSIGLMLAVGAVLTRRQVEHATLEGLAHQADVLTAREVFSILPLNHLRPLNKLVLAKQQEQARPEKVPRQRRLSGHAVSVPPGSAPLRRATRGTSSPRRTRRGPDR